MLLIFFSLLSSQKIKIAALRMYTCCVERINYDDFFDSKYEAAPTLREQNQEA